MTGVIGSSVITRIRVIVHDVDDATSRWSQFLGLAPEVGPVDAGKGPAMRVTYRGEPAPDAEIRCTLFRVAPNFYIELMQPNEFPSVWRDILDANGEGLHSLGFFVPDMAEAVRSSLAFGADLMQAGEFGTGDGRYAYLDFRADLKTIIEVEETDVPYQEIIDAAKAAGVADPIEVAGP
jgi:methylmalonyl-CoA/ethylmalonyl-CoA epimerase